MLTLDLPAEPYWLDLPRGVRVEIRPVTTAVMAAAQAAGFDEGPRAVDWTEQLELRGIQVELNVMAASAARQSARSASVKVAGQSVATGCLPVWPRLS